MNPRFDESTIRSFYSDSYYTGKAEYSYIDERESYTYSSFVWDARLKHIRRFVKSGNFLDVGCSFGGFLSRASRYFTPYGIELSEYSSDYARTKFGLNVFTGTLLDSPYQSGMFSVISMIEIIEHLDDPLAALIHCRKLLQDKGLLVIQTADMDGWQAVNAGKSYHYYLPGHLSYFTEKSLRYALAKAGFSRVVVYRPVDFGLIPKLRKSRGGFKTLSDYIKWIAITKYHLKGYFSHKGRPLTSSMVIYAFV
ncbi:MAG TPA: class I SAM-dependent methyltransferase [Spirochaetota bacterium]